MTRGEFEKQVRRVLKSLPGKFKDRLQNIDVVIEEGSPRQETLALYEGVSLNERSSGYSGVLPDKITLFQRAIEAESKRNKSGIREEIERTILHEIAHHFGITDERLKDLGVY